LRVVYRTVVIGTVLAAILLLVTVLVTRVLMIGSAN